MIPRLPRATWGVLVGDALSAVGAGMTLPFLVVYLHAGRGLSLVLAGLAVSALAIASLAGNLSSGVLCDRIGVRRTMIGGLLASAVGAILLIGVRHPWQAFAATGTVGLGASIVWPAQDAWLAALAGKTRASSIFSMRHATLNAGLGVGALLVVAQLFVLRFLRRRSGRPRSLSPVAAGAQPG